MLSKTLPQLLACFFGESNLRTIKIVGEGDLAVERREVVAVIVTAPAMNRKTNLISVATLVQTVNLDESRFSDQ